MFLRALSHDIAIEAKLPDEGRIAVATARGDFPANQSHALGRLSIEQTRFESRQSIRMTARLSPPAPLISQRCLDR